MSTVVSTTTAERIEQIATQCRTRYQPFPEPLISAICAYVEGNATLLQVRREWQFAMHNRYRYYNNYFIVFSDSAYMQLDEMDLRIAELCLALDNTETLLQRFADSPALEQIHQHLFTMKLRVPKVIKLLMLCHSMVKKNAGDQLVPTALGRLLLSYIPEHFAVMLKQLQVDKWRASTGYLFNLLMAAKPEGYLDMAEQVVRTLGTNQRDSYVAQLLQADPARYTDWAREVASASMQDTQQYNYYSLEALLKIDPARHLDLALQAARAPLSKRRWYPAKLQIMGLEAAFRLDPAQHLPLVEEAAVSASYYYGLKAVELLDGYDFEQARPILQRCIASGQTDAALKALGVLMKQRWPERQSYAISLLAHPARQIRSAILPWLWGETFFAETGALVDGIVPFLTHNQLYARHNAVLALQKIKDERIPDILAARLDNEKASEVRLAMLDTAGVAEAITPPADAPRTPEETLVAEAQAVLKYVPKAPLSWFSEEQAGALRWVDGEAVPPVVMNYLLFRQLRITNAALAGQMRQALPLFDRTSAGELALTIWNGWAANGARSNEAWCLTALCALGDERLIQILRQNIDGWSKGSRSALASKTVQAMAYIRSDLALAEISQLAERAKKNHVRWAAKEALNFSAANLGISLDELADRIVPTFGFDERGERIFDYGSRQFAAKIRFDQTVLLSDAKGKQLKNLPTSKAQDDAVKVGIARATWKLLKKQAPQVMHLQRQRMEVAMLAQRAWEVGTWQTFFLKHPLLRSLAVSLVWGVADAEGHGYQMTFRPLEDGSLTDNGDTPVTLPTEGQIRLVHPAAIDAQAQAAWLQHLADYEIMPPFSQMNRAVVRLGAEQREARWWEEYKGYLISESTLDARFNKAGWSSCSTPYPGYSLWKATASAGIEGTQESIRLAKLEEDGANLVITRLGFVAAGALKKTGSSYNTNDLQTEDARLLPLGQVPPVVFSEAATILQAAAGLGRYDEEWEKKIARPAEQR